MRTRSAALDAVRVLGIITVVLIHTAETPLLRAVLMPWNVTVFFVIAGYLWTRGRTLGDEARRRWSSLGRPYVAWLVLIGTPLVLAGAASPWGLAEGAHLGRPFSAFWFVAALLWATLLWRLLERVGLWAQVAAAVAGVVATSVAAPTLAWLPLSVGLVAPALVLLLAGQGLRAVRDRVPAGPTAAICLVLGAAVVLAGADPIDMKDADLGTPVVSLVAGVVISAGLVLGAEVVYRHLPSPVHQVTVALATAGLVVVLVHSAVIALVFAAGGLPAAAELAVVLGVSWAVGLVVVRTPAAPWLAGRPRVLGPASAAPTTAGEAGAPSPAVARDV